MLKDKTLLKWSTIVFTHKYLQIIHNEAVSVRVSDFVDAGCGEGGFVQVLKVRVSHGLPCRDSLGRIVGQHFLKR